MFRSWCERRTCVACRTLQQLQPTQMRLAGHNSLWADEKAGLHGGKIQFCLLKTAHLLNGLWIQQECHLKPFAKGFKHICSVLLICIGWLLMSLKCFCETPVCAQVLRVLAVFAAFDMIFYSNSLLFYHFLACLCAAVTFELPPGNNQMLPCHQTMSNIFHTAFIQFTDHLTGRNTESFIVNLQVVQFR